MTKVINVFGGIFVGLLGAICCVSLVGILLSISFEEFKYNVMDCFLTFTSSFILMALVGYIWTMIYISSICLTNRKDN